MNYSESMRKSRAYKVNQRFRRMFLVALIMGGLIGFFLGRITASAHKEITPDPVSATTDTLNTIVSEMPVINTPESIITPEEPEPILLGTYRITAYCSCEKCCGEWAKNRPDGIVYGAYGIELKPGVSCASTLPVGTVVEIEGLGEYTVQDRMAQWVIDKYGENLIDIYFADHEAACEFGLQNLNVYLKEEPAND